MKNEASLILFSSLSESVYVTARVSRGVDIEDVQKELGDKSKVSRLVETIISVGHLACTEHYTCFVPSHVFFSEFEVSQQSPLLSQNPWLSVTEDARYVMCNPRFLIEYHMNRYGWTYLDAFLFVERTYPVQIGYQKQLRKTLFVSTNIGCTREMNRHRGLSPLELSTRYLTLSQDDLNFTSELVEERCLAIPDYKALLEEGYSRDEARDLLPLGTGTKVYYTGFPKSWFHYFGLRRNPKTAHPMIRDLANKIYTIFKENNYL